MACALCKTRRVLEVVSVVGGRGRIIGQTLHKPLHKGNCNLTQKYISGHNFSLTILTQ